MEPGVDKLVIGDDAPEAMETVIEDDGTTVTGTAISEQMPVST